MMPITDKQRLLALYQEKSGEIKTFIQRRLGDEMAAEDLLQDLYIKLSKVKESTQIKNIQSYLFRMTHNLVIDWIRNKKHDFFLPPDISEILNNIQGGCDPQYAVEAKVELDNLERIMSRLPKRCREIFYLNRVERWKHKEIADHFGISVRAVQKNIKKVLEHGARHLDDFK